MFLLVLIISLIGLISDFVHFPVSSSFLFFYFYIFWGGGGGAGGGGQTAKKLKLNLLSCYDL